MTTKHIIITTATALGLVGTTFAQGEAPRRGPGPKEGKDRAARKAEFMKKFDKDGDGVLSGEEKKAAGDEMRKHWEKRKADFHAGMLKKFDKDGDGELSAEEKKVAREAMRKHWGDKARGPHGPRGHRGGEMMRKKMLEKFDKDGDGKLSEEERKAAREAMGDKMKEMRKGAEAMKKKFMETYDKDGDGELSEDERKAAREDMKAKWEAKKEEMLKLYDADGDGELSEDERKALREAKKEEMLNKFDDDNDGKLSAEEKKAAFQHLLDTDPTELMMMLKHRGRPHHGRKPCPKKKGAE